VNNSRPSCPICASEELVVFLDAPDQNLNHISSGSSRAAVSHGKIMRCAGCQFGFLAKRPDEQVLAQLYSYLDDRVYENESKGRRLTALDHYKIVSQSIKAGRILDVGCAYGSFLQVCSERGWEVVGIEPAERFCAKAKATLGERGEVICSTLQQALLPKDSFDVVTLWDVLEHVAEPVEFLRLCASLLKRGGFVFASVADLDSWQVRVLGSKWRLLLPEHFNYFNKESLQRCGELAGLTWNSFGRQPAFFSLGYIFYRLAQHKVPGASTFRDLLSSVGCHSRVLPVFLGEIYGVWHR
jgi:SAM-dependent methyltransferase